MDLPENLWTRVITCSREALSLRSVCRELRRQVSGVHQLLCVKKEAGDRELGLLAEAFRSVHTAVLRKCLNFSDAAVAAAVTVWSPALFFLDLSFVPVTDTCALTVADSCTNLRGLSLTGTSVTANGLTGVAKQCKALAVLDICVLDGICDESLKVLAELCGERLLALSLAQSDIDSPAIATGVKALATKCPQLRYLDLSYRCYDTDTLPILAMNCKGLRVLHVAQCDCVDDAAVVAIARNCPELESLVATSCANIGDEALRALTNCHVLERLLLWGCTGLSDAGVQALAGCRQLRELNVGMCRLSVAAIAAVGLECPKLERLYVGGLGKHASAELLTQLLDKRPRLQIYTLHVTFRVAFNFIDNFIG